MNKFRLASISVLALVLSVLVPIQTASAVTNFTKTVTVLGADGNPYSGAMVSLISLDKVDQRFVASAPVVTNSNGQAVITAPSAGSYLALSVEPPVSDTATALFTSELYSFTKFDESLTVNLEEANLRVKVLAPAGTDAPAGSSVAVPNGPIGSWPQTLVTVRTGSFGIAIPETLGAGDYELGIGSDSDVDAVNRNFALRIGVTGASTSRTVYSNESVESPVLNPTSGVYLLQLRPEEIRGVLKTSAGQSLTLPSGVRGRVVFTPSLIGGGLDRNHQGPKSSLLNSDGTFSAGLPSMRPGKYFAQILLSGSVAFPSFVGPEIWVDANGDYSLTQAGTYYSASTFSYVVNMPASAPNFILKMISASGASAPSFIDLYDDNFESNWWGPNDTANGIAAFVLPNGSYGVGVKPFDENEISPFNRIQLTVANGLPQVSINGQNVNATSGVTWDFQSTVANVHVRVMDPADSSRGLTYANVDVWSADGNEYVTGLWSNTGVVDLTVANGTYQLSVNAEGEGRYASRKYSLVINGTNVTIQGEDGEAPSASAGYFYLSPNFSNAVFRVVNPNDSSQRVEESQVNLRIPNGSHVDSIGSWDQDLGLLIPEGAFELEVNTQTSGFASSIYSVTRVGTAITVVGSDGNTVSSTNGVYLVSPAIPNVKFKVVSPLDASVLLSTSWLDVMDFTTDAYVARGEMRSGFAGLKLQNGKYKVRVSPGNQIAGLAENSYVLEMISGAPTLKTEAGVVVTPDGGFFFIAPKSANVLFAIKHPVTGSTLNRSYVQVFELDDAKNFRDWVTFGAADDGNAGISLPDGHYGIEVQAGGGGDALLAANRYELTVSIGGTALELKTWAGVTVNKTDGAFHVSPKAANLLIKVVNPDVPSQVVRGAYINIRDANNEWLPGAGVNNLGQAGINVADGTYSLEVNPGNMASGLATKNYTMVVSNSGDTIAISDSGTLISRDQSTSLFTLTPAVANVKLAIVDPTNSSVVLEQAWANVFQANGDSRGEWVAHANGIRPGFYLPNGTYQIEVSGGGDGSDYANKYYKLTVSGSAITVTTLANIPVVPSSGLFALAPATANVSLTVISPSGEVLPQSWVNVFSRTNNQWVTGAGTHRGNVSLNLPQGAYTVEVNPGSGSFASKKYALDVNGAGVATVVAPVVVEGRFQLAVAAANVLLKIVSPTDSTKLLSYAHVSVQRTSDNHWVVGAGGNSGYLSLRLEDGSYTMQLDPGNVVGEVLARKNFTVVVSDDGSVVAIGGAVADSSTNVFTLAAAQPAINGVVKMPGTLSPVPNSWVEPINSATGEHLWQNGANTNSSGIFGIAVPDGSYSLTAQVPWNSGYNLAKSAPCSVAVASGLVTTAAGGCVVGSDQNKSVVLTLREPNVTFRVADSEGNALPHANVSLQFGSWNVWANANSDGQVSMFIDPAEIKAKNPNATGVANLRAIIDPPYGNSSAVRTECLQGPNDANTLCDKIGVVNLDTLDAYVSQTIETIMLPAPNARINVTDPDGTSIGEGAWVAVLKVVGSGREWVGGSVTDSSGQAVFNLDPTATFVVEVNAPNGKRGVYASQTFEGLTLSQLNNSTRALALPNLKLQVMQPGGLKASKWSWVNIEKIDANGNPIDWVPGSGTDDLGQASSSLVAGDYRLTVYPGGASAGARTTCDIHVVQNVVTLKSSACSAGEIISGALKLTLSLGNVTGTISNGAVVLPGAIVVAQHLPGQGSTQLPDQQYTTGADGKYGFQLNSGQWKIKVYFVNEDGGSITPDLVGTEITVAGDYTYNKNLAG